jgi:hypothetical protein
MALSENGERDAARPKIDRSLAQNPNNFWAAHARAHLCYVRPLRLTPSERIAFPRGLDVSGGVGWQQQAIGDEGSSRGFDPTDIDISAAVAFFERGRGSSAASRSVWCGQTGSVNRRGRIARKAVPDRRSSQYRCRAAQ